MENAPVSKTIDWHRLSTLAWEVRESSYIIGNTKVGCAIVCASGEFFIGCNIEQTFRSHDVHAEVNAISTMIANGEQTILGLLVVAERERFTPCGACMDWIFQFGGPDCQVGFQNTRNSDIEIYKAKELMPYYPY